MSLTRGLLPPDPTIEEIKIVDALATHIYQLFDDPWDMLVLALVFDCGYGKEDVARALKRSHVTVWKRIKRIENTLYPYGKKEHVLD
jgi:hypothetical protein